MSEIHNSLYFFLLMKNSRAPGLDDMAYQQKFLKFFFFFFFFFFNYKSSTSSQNDRNQEVT